MKKILALALAAAMLLSMGVVAYARPVYPGNSSLIPSDASIPSVYQVFEGTMLKYYGDVEGLRLAEQIGFGDTAYFPLYWVAGSYPILVTEEKSVAGIKVTAQWDDNGEYVDSVGIARKDGHYSVFVKIKESSSISDDLVVSGKIYLKGNSGSGDTKEKIDAYFTVDIPIGYYRVTSDELADPYSDMLSVNGKKLYVTDREVIYDLGDITEDSFKIYYGGQEVRYYDERVEISGGEDGGDIDISSMNNGVATQSIPENWRDSYGSSHIYAIAETDVTNVEDILLYYNTDTVEEVAAAYPLADIDYLKLAGNFKKTADVTIYADPGTYLYQWANGKLTKVDAEYDEFDESFNFTAKRLGQYIIANLELDTEKLPTGGETTVVPNPTTGAIL